MVLLESFCPIDLHLFFSFFFSVSSAFFSTYHVRSIICETAKQRKTDACESIVELEHQSSKRRSFKSVTRWQTQRLDADCILLQTNWQFHILCCQWKNFILVLCWFVFILLQTKQVREIMQNNVPRNLWSRPHPNFAVAWICWHCPCVNWLLLMTAFLQILCQIRWNGPLSDLS